MRMQPDDTLVPTVQGSLVPWIRYSVSLLPCQRYMARAPSGFRRTTRDADATLQFGKLAAQVGSALDHLLGWVPIRPFLLVVDDRLAPPGKAFIAYADPVAHGAPTLFDKVQVASAGVATRARRNAGLIRDNGAAGTGKRSPGTGPYAAVATARGSAGVGEFRLLVEQLRSLGRQEVWCGRDFADACTDRLLRCATAEACPQQAGTTSGE